MFADMSITPFIGSLFIILREGFEAMLIVMLIFTYLGRFDSQGKEKWINDKRLRIIKAFQIQRHWRNCSCNPEYKLAHKLIKERISN